MAPVSFGGHKKFLHGTIINNSRYDASTVVSYHWIYFKLISTVWVFDHTSKRPNKAH
jgi:hypothetical protein